MSNHHSKNVINKFPDISINWKRGKHNTNKTRDDFIEEMRKTLEYKREFNYRTGKLEIWFKRDDGFICKITIWNKFGYSTIVIEHFSLDKKLSEESHKFNPLGFSDSVNTYLLTPEDLEQQRVFEEQEKIRKEVLEIAHDAGKCGGVDNCKYCYSSAVTRQIIDRHGT